MPVNSDILAQLQRDIWSLQGFKPHSAGLEERSGLGRINQSFPNGVFPFAALHEFLCDSVEEAAAATGFLSGLLSPLMQQQRAAVWISGGGRSVFPPALKAFCVPPHQVIFLHIKKEKERAWAMEEALKCSALAAVVGELPRMSFNESRRFQLAIEQSGVACFVLRQQPQNMSTVAVTRWQVKPVPTVEVDSLPGVGHPRWQVNLLKVRNGRPGSWEVEWANGMFRHVSKLAVLPAAWQKKTG